MFGFKKKVKKAAVAVAKMENRGAVNATVWGGYFISYADGSCDPAEVNVLEKTIQAVPAFQPFAGEIATMSGNAKQQFEASPRRAAGEALRVLGEIAGTTDAVDVLNLCIDIADRDGIGEQEMGALKKIAQALQLNLDQYLA